MGPSSFRVVAIAVVILATPAGAATWSIPGWYVAHFPSEFEAASSLVDGPFSDRVSCRQAASTHNSGRIDPDSIYLCGYFPSAPQYVPEMGLSPPDGTIWDQ